MKKLAGVPGLQDIELPPQGLSVWLVALIILLCFILVWYLFSAWRKRQQPLNQAKRQLQALSMTSSNPDQIAKILRDALQVRRLKEGGLSEDFIQRLQQARFSSEACSIEKCVALKKDALRFLMERSA